MSTTGTSMARPAAPHALAGKACIGALSVVSANLGFLIVYLVFELTLFQLAVVYWWECLWIGLFCALKLLVASAIGVGIAATIPEVASAATFAAMLIVCKLVWDVRLHLRERQAFSRESATISGR